MAHYYQAVDADFMAISPSRPDFRTACKDAQDFADITQGNATVISIYVVETFTPKAHPENTQ